MISQPEMQINMSPQSSQSPSQRSIESFQNDFDWGIRDSDQDDYPIHRISISSGKF